MAKSLAATTPGALTQELKLPSIFSAPEPVKARDISPYVVFAHPKRADEWAKLTAKFGNIAEGSMFLVTSQELYELPLAKLGWIHHRQYWASANPAGELLSASWTEMPKPFKEHVESVVLVYLEDKIVPANMSFRSTKCPAAKTMADTFAECQTPKWADKSAAHKETLVCQQAFMRFFGEVQLGPQRIAKSTGLPYRPTQCNVKPTTLTEWRLLKAMIEDENTQKALNAAAERFEWRMKELTAKIGK